MTGQSKQPGQRHNLGYELLDSGNGVKLERFGDYVLVRPSLQAVWSPRLKPEVWDGADAFFYRSERPHWRHRSALPESWKIEIDGLRFILSSTDSGNLGVFPEQRLQWRWITDYLSGSTQGVSVLNLFAYSGGSTLAAARAGAEVCHLDAARVMVDRARNNAELNGLADRPVRWIAEDAHKFMYREIRRGRRYNAIILDPPTFGRGTKGEIYQIELDLPETLTLCRELLDRNPLFVLLSAHTPGFSPLVLENLLRQAMEGLDGKFESGEMFLNGTAGTLPLPSGAFARWSNS